MASAWKLDADTRDAVTELLNIGVGRAASILSELIAQRIELNVPQVRLFESNSLGIELFSEQQSPETIITQAFEGLIRGRTSLCFSAASGVSLAKLLSGNSSADQSELDSELTGILLEVGNIVLNGVMSSLSNAMSSELHYSLPVIQTANRRGERLMIDTVQDDDALVCNVRFRVAEQDIEGTILVVCAVGYIHRMLQTVLEPSLAN